MHRHLPPLSKALARLAASDTPHKRSNALKAFAKAVKELQGRVASDYPKLRSDGTAIVPRKRRGAWCPHCKRPLPSFRQLARHLTETLNPPNRRCPECWCGGKFRNMQHLTRHLASIPDLRKHYLPWAMREFAKEFGK